MKKLFMFAAVLCTCFITTGQEVAAKPGVIGLDIEGNLVRKTVWAKYGKDFAPEFGDGTATFTSDDVEKVQGLIAIITVNQSEAKPIIFSAESKAENVSIKRRNNYSFYVDVTYADNSRGFATAAMFKSGSHDWEKEEIRFSPEKPVKIIRAHLLFRYVTGTASFRNAFVSETE